MNIVVSKLLRSDNGDGYRGRMVASAPSRTDDVTVAISSRVARGSRINAIVLAARTARLLWKRNGVRWLFVFGIYAAQSQAARFLSDRLQKMERERKLPGLFEPAIAAHVWQNYDWRSVSVHGY